jgi:hemoglobin
MPGTRELSTPADVRALIEAFYARARPDPLIGHFFTTLDWDHHIPLIASFWEMVLFGDRKYQGDPMTAHVHLHQRIPMEPDHFERWLSLFDHTVDSLFTGPKADEAKQRARTIAGVIAHRVTGR